MIQTEAEAGTGFYVTGSGEVITAGHVVLLPDGTPAKRIRIAITASAIQFGTSVITNGTFEVSATIEAVDRAHDLALLKPAEYPFLNDAVDVNGRDLIPARHPATICPRTLKLRSGDPVFIIGHPLGDLRLVTTQGIVASDDGVQTGVEGVLNGTYLVDMLVNHGNSGGPVSYPTGHCVIGVVDSISVTPVEALGPNGATPLPPLPLTD